MWNCSTNPRALQECISHTTYKSLSLDFGLYKKRMFTLGRGDFNHKYCSIFAGNYWTFL